jgi:Leucine-rich repeat (LRR) protein
MNSLALAFTLALTPSVLEGYALNRIKSLNGISTFDSSGPGRRADIALARLNISDSDLRTISHVRGIERLSLAGTKVSDDGLRALGSAAETLVVLDLHSTEISEKGIAYLQNHQSLKMLILRRTKVRGAVLPSIARLNQLEHLDLSDTDLRGIDFATLAGSKLKVLYLADTKIGDSELTNIRRLRHLSCLDLSSTKITDKGLDYLHDLPELDTVYLRGVKVPDTALQRLQLPIGSIRIRR